jgi:hypothetical protein
MGMVIKRFDVYLVNLDPTHLPALKAGLAFRTAWISNRDVNILCVGSKAPFDPTKCAAIADLNLP